jgi:hypothetical protein
MTRFQYIVTLLSVVTLIAFLATAYSFTIRTDTSRMRFCTLDRTLVTFIDNGLAGVTLQQALEKPDQYQRYYDQSTGLVRELIAQAPCDFPYQIPPNVLS